MDQSSLMGAGEMMSTFHIHARLIEGSLRNPERDELRVAEADEWDQIIGLARELVAQGFTVWIYGHGGSKRYTVVSDYRSIATLRPDQDQAELDSAQSENPGQRSIRGGERPTMCARTGPLRRLAPSSSRK